VEREYNGKGAPPPSPPFSFFWTWLRELLEQLQCRSTPLFRLRTPFRELLERASQIPTSRIMLC
jgi:hypothetical protein